AVAARQYRRDRREGEGGGGGRSRAGTYDSAAPGRGGGGYVWGAGVVLLSVSLPRGCDCCQRSQFWVLGQLSRACGVFGPGWRGRAKSWRQACSWAGVAALGTIVKRHGRRSASGLSG